jgi:hypothetical protein
MVYPRSPSTTSTLPLASRRLFAFLPLLSSRIHPFAGAGSGRRSCSRTHDSHPADGTP